MPRHPPRRRASSESRRRKRLAKPNLELRQDYGIGGLGSYLESPTGGTRLRLFRQNGSTANTGALFLACVCQFFLRRTDWIDQRSTGRGSIFLAGITDQFRNRFIRLQNAFERHTISPDGMISAGVYIPVYRDSVVLTLIMRVVTNLWTAFFK